MDRHRHLQDLNMHLPSWRIFLRLVSLALVFLLLWTIWTAWVIVRDANLDEAQPAGVIVVLGAAVFGDQPSPVFQERINHALTLYQAGYASTLIFTGGYGEGAVWAESEVARQVALDQGIPPEAILIEIHSRTTEQNLYYAYEIALDHDLRSAILVSDPLHMARAMLIAGDIDLVVYRSPTPTSRYRTWSTRGPFLLREVYYFQRYVLRRRFYRYGGE